MKSARSWRDWARVACWSVLISVSAPACSLLFELGADQCTVDRDCARVGSDLSCRAGLCVADPDGGGSGGKGNGGSSAGTSASGDAGEGGNPSPPECVNNAECMEGDFEPFACVDGNCVPLLTDECPLLIGAENLKAPAPILFGAYTLAENGVNRSVVTRNIDLVVSEITSKVTGLRGGPGGSARTIAFLVCNSYFPDVPPGTIDAFRPSLDHLVDDLRVPGIISALSAKDLQAVFSQRLNDAGTFVISPFEKDSELAAIRDKGRLWHMLGATSDLAPAFGALIKRTEDYLRRTGTYLNLPSPEAKLRVALVSANIARETDVRDALLELPALDDFEVEQFQVDSALLTASPDVGPLGQALLEYKPHIIVGLAGSEFIRGIFPLLETKGAWPTDDQQRPMYVLGSTMAPETWALYGKTEALGGFPTLMNRIVGVAYSSAEDPTLRKNYEARLLSANTDLLDSASSLLLGSENVYDATYLMLYAAAAAGEVPELTGLQLARGMQRLLEGKSYDVGPAAISGVLNALENEDTIGLNLTLGPPNWNAANGTRKGVGSAYCLNNQELEYERMFSEGPNTDVLRYDPETDALEDKPLPCFPNF